MAANTAYKPINVVYYDGTKLNKNATGVAGTATAGGSTNIDYELEDDMLLSGGNVFLVSGATLGDTVDLQVLDSMDNVIAQPITSWYINPEVVQQVTPTANYGTKGIAGLTIRLVYHSVGEENVWVAINYNFEKILE